jgi:hypothetical protein
MMQKSIAKESRHRLLARRLGVAVLALAALLALGACRATGGGYLPPQVGFPGKAEFGFNFTCEVETEKKRAVIRGTITYQDDPSPMAPEGVKLHGTVDPLFIELTEPVGGVDPTCENADVLAQIEGVPYARFQGEYRSEDGTLPAPYEQGRFQVDVFDRGEPSLDGDSFHISLTGNEEPDFQAPVYDRFGFIEGGNIQVENE